MKKTLKLLTAGLLVCATLVGFAACGNNGGSGNGDSPVQIALSSTNGVDVYSYDSGWNVSAKLTGTADAGGRKAELVNGVIVVTVPATDVDVELNLAPFFGANTAYKGTDFHFTRSDVKVTGSQTELLKGYAWVETVAGDAANRKYKQLGYETDDTKLDLKKAEIQALSNRKGEVRMYILTNGSHAGRHVTYVNKDVNPDLQKLSPYFDEVITYRFIGHNGKKAEFKVKVVQVAAA